MPEFSFCPRCAKPLELRQESDRERSACPDRECGFVHYDNPTPVVGAIVEYEGKIILVRSHGWPAEWFGLVTGFLEKNETPEEGIVREIEEEIGLTGEIVEFLGPYPFYELNQLILVYHVRATGTLELGEEIAEYRAIAPEKVRPWPMGTGPALRDWLVAKGYRDSREEDFRHNFK